MHIHLLSIGKRAPDWVSEGFGEYARRMPRECSLELHEIASARRSRSDDMSTVIAQEGKKLLAATPKNSILIALDEAGVSWGTQKLSEQMGAWLQGGKNVTLLLGGADGLSKECKGKAQHIWSLSSLTLPHMLVRVVVAEQLYRAWSLLQGHPYHRAG